MSSGYSPSIRVCVPRFDDVYQVSEKGPSGVAEPLFQLLLNVVAGLNVSFVQTSSSGVLLDPVNQVYDGCIGSIFSIWRGLSASSVTYTSAPATSSLAATRTGNPRRWPTRPPPSLSC